MSKTAPEQPRTSVTLPELRAPIDHANSLILTAFCLCLASPEEAQTAPTLAQRKNAEILEEWSEGFEVRGVPHAVVETIVRTLDTLSLTTNEENLETGLTVLLHALEIRFWATRKVGTLKAEYSLPVLDQAREDAILLAMQREIALRGLPSELVNFFAVLMTAVREEHQALRN